MLELAKMIEEVLTFIKRHQLIHENATVLAGVSGGPDSMALLHFLAGMRKDWKLRLIAVSVDHQIRGEASAEDMLFVKEVCRSWNIEFAGTSVSAPAYKEKEKVSIEVAAREVRYEFFRQQMIRFNADYLALGHHGDDQAETLLMKLSRTASSLAFHGIPHKREFSGGQIIRPFLCLSKLSIEEYCSNHDIPYRIDPTNMETEYTRNLYRNNVLPHLKEKNSNIHKTAQLLAETLAEDDRFLWQEAQKMADELVDFEAEKKRASFSADLFKNRDHALQRRAIHLILKYLYDDLPEDLSYVHEQQLFALLERKDGSIRIDFPSALKVENAYGKITFYFSGHQDEHDTSAYSYRLEIPGQQRLPDGSIITAEIAERHTEKDVYSYSFYADQVVLPLHIRTREPGDRMRWKGLNGSRKLKDIFIDLKIPAAERDSWPVVTDGRGEILWLIGLKKGQADKQSGSGPIIQLHYEKGNI